MPNINQPCFFQTFLRLRWSFHTHYWLAMVLWYLILVKYGLLNPISTNTFLLKQDVGQPWSFNTGYWSTMVLSYQILVDRSFFIRNIDQQWSCGTWCQSSMDFFSQLSVDQYNSIPSNGRSWSFCDQSMCSHTHYWLNMFLSYLIWVNRCLYAWCFNNGILMLDIGQPLSFRKQNRSKLLFSFPLLPNYGLYLLNLCIPWFSDNRNLSKRSFCNWFELSMATSDMIMVVHDRFIPNTGRPWSLHTWCCSVMFFLYPPLLKHFHSQY